jgi:hypothetical protein
MPFSRIFQEINVPFLTSDVAKWEKRLRKRTQNILFFMTIIEFPGVFFRIPRQTSDYKGLPVLHKQYEVMKFIPKLIDQAVKCTYF